MTVNFKHSISYIFTNLACPPACLLSGPYILQFCRRFFFIFNGPFQPADQLIDFKMYDQSSPNCQNW